VTALKKEGGKKKKEQKSPLSCGLFYMFLTFLVSNSLVVKISISKLGH